jgi:hypothetical protein
VDERVSEVLGRVVEDQHRRPALKIIVASAMAYSRHRG